MLMVLKPLKKAIDDDNICRSTDIVENCIDISQLTKSHKMIIREEIHDFVSESSRTVPDIANKLGIHVNTVYAAHRDERYRRAFTLACDRLFQDMAHIGYSSIVKSARDGKVSAAKLILEITGKHVDKIQTANVNVNVDITPEVGMNPRVAVEQFLTMLGTRGWSIEEINQIWASLKESQAF